MNRGGCSYPALKALSTVLCTPYQQLSAALLLVFVRARGCLCAAEEGLLSALQRKVAGVPDCSEPRVIVRNTMHAVVPCVELALTEPAAVLVACSRRLTSSCHACVFWRAAADAVLVVSACLCAAGEGVPAARGTDGQGGSEEAGLSSSTACRCCAGNEQQCHAKG